MKLKDIIYGQIISEVRESDIIFSYNDKVVVDTSHATSRFLERVGKDISLDSIKTRLFIPMIKRISRMAEHGKVVAEEMLVYSKSLRQAVIVAFRSDRFDLYDTYNFYIISYLPRGRHEPSRSVTQPGVVTPVILVESHEESMSICSPELTAYLSDLVINSGVTLDETTINYDYLPVKLDEGLDYKIMICQNKIYDIDLQIIEID